MCKIAKQKCPSKIAKLLKILHYIIDKTELIDVY